MRWSALVACVLAACGDASPPAAADAGAPDATPPVVVEAPAPPALPSFLPCPSGWREVAGPEGTTVCDPWPEGGPAACAAADEAHFPGEPACRRIGSPCPAGDWPEGLPVDRPILYVRAGAPAGGDGSLASPFSTIAAATAAAAPDGVIALAKGTYDEPVALPAGVALVGACVEATRLVSSLPHETAAVVSVATSGAAAELRDVQIAGARPGIRVAGGGALDVAGVLVAGATGVGVGARAGALAGRDLVVRDTAAFADGTMGRGLNVSYGGSADLEGVVFERNREVGVAVIGYGSTARLRGAAVRATVPGQNGWFGRGMSVEGGGAATLEASVVEANRELAVYVEDARLTADGVVLADTAAATGGQGGVGLFAAADSDVTLARVRVSRNRSLGVVVEFPGATLRASDLVVEATLPTEADLGFGAGVGVQFGGQAELTRAVVAGNRMTGVFASHEGTVLALTDVTIVDTAAQESDGRFGRGLAIKDAATVTTTRLHLARNTDTGIIAFDAATSVAIADLVVRDTAVQLADGRFGRGLEMQAGVHVTLARARFEGNHDSAIAVFDPGSALTGADVVLAGTLALPDGTGGRGAGAYLDATVALTRFEVTDNVMLGLQLARGAAIDLHGGTVARNPIGVNVQTEGFDLARLQDGVVYVDNGVNLDSTQLPVPEPGDPF